MIYFTSDTHFLHKRILEFQKNRPWKTVDEMNRGLIDLWNKTVGPRDTIYHLGDFALNCTPEEVQSILVQLKGNIFLVPGNHDQARKIKGTSFQVLPPIFEVKWNHHRMICSHFPQASWNHDRHGSWMLHGHCHGCYDPNQNYFNPGGMILDVGVDGPLGPGPVAITAIEAYMKDRPVRTRGDF